MTTLAASCARRDHRRHLRPVFRRVAGRSSTVCKCVAGRPQLSYPLDQGFFPLNKFNGVQLLCARRALPRVKPSRARWEAWSNGMRRSA